MLCYSLGLGKDKWVCVVNETVMKACLKRLFCASMCVYMCVFLLHSKLDRICLHYHKSRISAKQTESKKNPTLKYVLVRLITVLSVMFTTGCWAEGCAAGCCSAQKCKTHEVISTKSFSLSAGNLPRNTNAEYQCSKFFIGYDRLWLKVQILYSWLLIYDDVSYWQISEKTANVSKIDIPCQLCKCSWLSEVTWNENENK